MQRMSAKGGERTFANVVNKPTTNTPRIRFANPIALGADDCDAARHLD